MRRWPVSSWLLAISMLPGWQSSLGAAPADAFSEREATQVLRQVAAGLAAHNSRKMLSAFDLERMRNGSIFEQNILSFFGQTGTIRVHYNVLSTSTDGATGVAEVTMEMEADMTDDRLPVLHKQAQLHVVCEKSTGGWRITDLTPRDFFSTQP
ncbi:MAG TPA: hypothetical protein VKW06_21490 [Candidatus Angelobacter sp.]|nr:hypothetical protein [Candidatus Angelobacter sp.]